MLTSIINAFPKFISKEMLRTCLCKGLSSMSQMNSDINMFGGINTKYYENDSKSNKVKIHLK
jgi:hypothetical protein